MQVVTEFSLLQNANNNSDSGNRKVTSTSLNMVSDTDAFPGMFRFEHTAVEVPKSEAPGTRCIDFKLLWAILGLVG